MKKRDADNVIIPVSQIHVVLNMETSPSQLILLIQSCLPTPSHISINTSLPTCLTIIMIIITSTLPGSHLINLG